RHQKVYATLGELMGQFHALALHTYTPEEWAEQGAAPDSPTCRGGSKHDH
ncbi:BolA/IbaG family iron-sulfur metabolism protein, partial [Pseudomonas citronellolis]